MEVNCKVKVKFKDGNVLEQNAGFTTPTRRMLIDDLRWFSYNIERQMLEDGQELKNMVSMDFKVSYE